MKRIISLNLLKLSALIILVSFSKAEALNNNTSEEFRPVDSNRIPEILTMISNCTKSNYEQIKTWQGELGVVTDDVYEGDRAEKIFRENTSASGEPPKKLLEHRETNIKFSLDAKNELLYAEYYNDSAKPLQYIDLENVRDLNAKGRLSTRKAILTPEYQIDCIADTLQYGVIKRRIAVKQACPKNSSTCGGHPVYDPRMHLSLGDQTWEFFPKLIKYINENGKYSVGGFDLQVEERKTGDTNDYRMIKPSRTQGDENYLFHEMVFSGDSGFNTISLQTTYQNKKDANKVILKKEISEYKRFNKVYVPCNRLEQTFSISGMLTKEEKITFKNQLVNEPIPEETFTYKNLGLKDGDKFIDKILDKEFTYKDGKLTEDTKKTD